MASKVLIKCHTGPIGEEGPLVLRLEDDIRIISATIAPMGTPPRGLSIDHAVIFDMQPDGGVDGIEILCDLGIDLASRSEAPRRREKYCRLFLDPSGKEIFEPDVKVVMRRRDNVLTVRFLNGAVDSKYLLGPGVTALVGANELLGLSIDMVTFTWPEFRGSRR
jgi:hypothetical protein